MRCLLCLLLLLLTGYQNAFSQNDGGNVLLQVLHQHPEQFDSVLANREKYRLQIIYTQIDRDENNYPHFTTYALDTGKYFYYCASMIKLLEIPLAIEKINQLTRLAPVSIYDSISISGDVCGDASEAAYRKRDNFSTPAQLIKEMLLVSNNHAFNPLYDLLTQSYFNRRAHELGYTSAVICNRFAACDTFQNTISNAVILSDRVSGRPKYIQQTTVNPDMPVVPMAGTVVGKGFLNGTSIDAPKDFAHNNYISLADLHRLVLRLIFPVSQPKHQQLQLTDSDYLFIRKYMGMYPRESVFPKYDSIQYPDNKLKLFVELTDSTHAPANIRVFNKVGQAYGFVTDCSYIADTVNRTEFILSCSMYVNNDEILNDGIYEYETTAFPFFRNLYRYIYQLELSRKRTNKPVFDSWNFTDTVF
jgi:hypothetical protein